MLKFIKFLFIFSIFFTIKVGIIRAEQTPTDRADNNRGKKPWHLRYVQQSLPFALLDCFEAQKAKEGYEKAWGPKFKFVYDGERIKDIIYLPEGKSFSALPNKKEIYFKELAHFLDIAKKEMFPYYQRMILACEEYAGYFLFWEAYYNSYKDVKKARDLIEETAKRYPEASPGKIAEEILRKAKTEKQLVSLIQEEFKNLPNPVETYTSREGEPENSAMNNLKKAIAPTEEYNKWKDIALLGKYQNLQKEEAMKLACQAIEEIISILDETIASYYYRLAHYCLIAPDQDFNMFRHFLVLIVSRYPHTSRAESAKHNLKVFTKPGID